MAVKDGLPATDFSRMNREWVKAVAEGGSGGGGLPEITEADEGKVLTVESGEAAWATAGGGGSDILVVTITEEESGDDYIYTFSPSIDDIVTATEAGKLVMGMVVGGTATTQVDCYKNAVDDWGISVIFPSFAVDETGIHIYIDTYAQTNNDESMTYDSAEGLVTAV